MLAIEDEKKRVPLDGACFWYVVEVKLEEYGCGFALQDMLTSNYKYPLCGGSIQLYNATQVKSTQRNPSQEKSSAVKCSQVKPDQVKSSLSQSSTQNPKSPLSSSSSSSNACSSSSSSSNVAVVVVVVVFVVVV